MTFELDASLKRLGTDYVDIYYLHRDDLETPLEETVSTIGDFIRAGKMPELVGRQVPERKVARGCPAP